jgi:hypothetical protein
MTRVRTVNAAVNDLADLSSLIFRLAGEPTTGRAVVSPGGRESGRPKKAGPVSFADPADVTLRDVKPAPLRPELPSPPVGLKSFQSKPAALGLQPSRLVPPR